MQGRGLAGVVLVLADWVLADTALVVWVPVALGLVRRRLWGLVETMVAGQVRVAVGWLVLAALVWLGRVGGIGKMVRTVR
ncbi:hypothetical protein CAQUA_03635 [Corynebacterium aquatimens]|nr:hypothetical protein CAQUA_03635 [Corynebacterium aquatimens]